MALTRPAASRSQVQVAALAVATWAGACSAPSPSSAPPADAVDVEDRGANLDEPLVGDDAGPLRLDIEAPVDVTDEAGDGGSAGDRPPLVAGTDSEEPPADVTVDPVTEARLADFGRLYLGYDHRIDHGEVLAGYENLVSPDLLGVLAVPIPSSLEADLVADERVVDAEFVAARSLGPAVYAVDFLLHRSGTSTGDADPQPRTLVVTLDEDRLVSDVR